MAKFVFKLQNILSIKEKLEDQAKPEFVQEPLLTPADEAMKERKTFEKLKEKAFEEFKLEIEAQEKKEVDELTSFRFGSARESEEI